MVQAMEMFPNKNPRHLYTIYECNGRNLDKFIEAIMMEIDEDEIVENE